MKVTPVEIFKITDGGTIFFSTKDKPQRLHQDSYRRHRRLPFGAQHRQVGDKFSAVELEIDHLYILPVTAPQFYSRRGHFYFVDIQRQLNSNQADQREAEIKSDSRVSHSVLPPPF
jgi:hypothetical protein